MPVGGFVVTVDPGRESALAAALTEAWPTELEVHGMDKEGNLVVVLDTVTSRRMEELTGLVQEVEGVLSVGLAYLNVEDEVAGGSMSSEER